MQLTVFQWQFIGEYLKDNAATAAIRRAGYEGFYPGQEAYRMLNTPIVKAEIDRCRVQLVEKVHLGIEDIVQDIKSVLTADARELVDHVTGACRYCHGVHHRYQRTPQEDRDAQQKGGYDPMGGIGFTPKKEPHPDCPECFGEGEMRVVSKDTRYLSKGALALYDGVKATRNGVEVKVRSRDAARIAGAQYLGMNKLDLTLNDSRKAKDMTDDELAAVVDKAAK